MFCSCRHERTQLPSCPPSGQLHCDGRIRSQVAAGVGASVPSGAEWKQLNASKLGAVILGPWSGRIRTQSPKVGKLAEWAIVGKSGQPARVRQNPKQNQAQPKAVLASDWSGGRPPKNNPPQPCFCCANSPTNIRSRKLGPLPSRVAVQQNAHQGLRCTTKTSGRSGGTCLA